MVYSAEDDGHTQKIVAGGARLFPSSQMTLCRHPEAIVDALKGVLSGYGILLALIRGRGELERLIPMEERLRDHSVILIIEDEGPDLMSLSLKLYPRYTSGFKERYTDIFQVLENMITKIETKAKGEEYGRVRGDCRH